LYNVRNLLHSNNLHSLGQPRQGNKGTHEQPLQRLKSPTKEWTDINQSKWSQKEKDI
jgi:hypothetical protein